MKKVLFAITVVAALGYSVASCKSETKKESEEVTTEITEKVKEHHEEIEHHDIAKATYQCPMNCEDGKTYEAPGQCPACKMDLKEVEVDVEKHEHKEGEEQDHGSGEKEG